MHPPAPVVSICILTRRVSAALDRCLASLQVQEGEVPFEVLIASDGDPSVAQFTRARFPDAVVGLVQGAHPGHARNFLTANARGELLWFLDDDVVVPPSALQHLVQLAAANPSVAVFGGPNLTPPHSTFFERVQGAVLRSVVGSGPVRRRYRQQSSGPADDRFLILCNLAVRRERMLPFPPELIGGEENALLTELRRLRLPMLYDQGLAVFHERRPTLASFATQMRKYGRGRGQAIRRRPSSARVGYLVPVALLGYLVTLPLLAVLSPWLFAPLLAYFAAIGFAATRIGVRLGSVRAFGISLVLLVVMHCAYGVGIVHGLSRRARRRVPHGEESFVSLPAKVV